MSQLEFSEIKSQAIKKFSKISWSAFSIEHRSETMLSSTSLKTQCLKLGKDYLILVSAK